MPDETTAPVPAGTEAGAATDATIKAPEQPVVIAQKPAPTDELGETIDQFFAGFQSAGLRTMKTILTQFKAKADAVITKLDGDAGGDTTKKP